MVPVPRRVAAERLGNCRDGEFKQGAENPQRQAEAARYRQRHHVDHPVDLHQEDTDGISDVRPAAGGIVVCGAQPEQHHGETHDDIAKNDHGKVRRRLKQELDAGRHGQRSAHQDHRQEPVHDVVIVVGRRKPGEVHPGPPDAKESNQEGNDTFARMVFRNRMVQAGRRRRDRDHRHEVEQQFERGCGPMMFVRIPGMQGPQDAGEW